MILKGTEDLRVQKTIEAINTAFKDLITEMDFEKITVKELTARARINKKTFYRYYLDLDDLLAELQTEMSMEYLERVKHYKLPEDLEKVNREFFQYSVEKGKVYEKITCSGNYQMIRQKMINNVMASTWNQSEILKPFNIYQQNILLTFLETSSIEIYKRWVEDGKKLELEDIISISNSLINGGIKSFLKNTSIISD